MNILVTGGSGFVGSHLCEHLYNEKYNVIAQGKKGEIVPKSHYFLKCDLEKLCTVEFPKIDICFHQAANNNTLDRDYQDMFLVNVELPKKLFETLYYKFDCKNFVFASSCAIYGNEPCPFKEDQPKQPLNAYAKSKLLFEEFAIEFSKNKDIKMIGLRYSNVYGKNELHKGKRASMVSQILENIQQGLCPQLFKFGEQRRDWVYIDDVIKANKLAMMKLDSGFYNVGSGEALSFQKIVEIINGELDVDLQPKYIDCNFSDRLQNYTLLDIKKISAFGYSPSLPAEQQIRSYVRQQKKAMANAMA